MDIQAQGLYLTLITGLAFVTGLLVLYIHSLRKQYRQRIWLTGQQLFREVELIDSERERIANDLHDEFGSGLAAIGLLLQQAKERKDKGVLDKACLALEDQRKKIRQVAYNFVPRILSTHGLRFALNDLIDELSIPAEPVLEMDLNMDDTLFKTVKSVHVYRIIREIVFNTLQHAQATRIRLSSSQDNSYLNLFIQANGISWLPAEDAAKGKGLGLHSIATRIKLLNAHLVYGLSENRENVCRIRIPLSSMQ